jgi:alkylhydroperoxidase family enzyme
MTESVTRISESHLTQTEIDEAAAVFSPEELTKLLYAIIEINSWNRLVLTTGSPEPGSYRVAESA